MNQTLWIVLTLVIGVTQLSELVAILFQDFPLWRRLLTGLAIPGLVLWMILVTRALRRS